MSQSLGYFPPQGTKYRWSSKALNYSPWVCSMWDYWPASIVAYVDLDEGGTYHWRVEVRGFRHMRKVWNGTEGEALLTCLAAERVCDEEKGKIWLPWMDLAVAAGWLPTCLMTPVWCIG